ncbi:MAG: biopolymer transporter ExbD [Bacteroidetes bacterium]|nr:biopolymer transporter ExbD [Bacteroidota bacterium]
MGGLDTGGGGGGSGASAGRHKKKRGKRVGIKMDMTPMVDVAFLLLTFFMLTAVFSQPLAMEINLPPPDSGDIEMAESNVLQIRVDKDSKLYWGFGNDVPTATTMQEIGTVLRQNANRNDKTVTVLKVSRESEYVTAIDLLDEFEVADVTRFAISPLTPQDAALMQQAQTSTGG